MCNCIVLVSGIIKIIGHYSFKSLWFPALKVENYPDPETCVIVELKCFSVTRF